MSVSGRGAAGNAELPDRPAPSPTREAPMSPRSAALPSPGPSIVRRLGGLAGDVAGPALRGLTRPPARRTSGRTGRTHIEVRGMDTPDRADARKAVVDEMLA